MKNIRYILWTLVGIAFVGFILLSLPPKNNTESSIPTPIAGFNQGVPFILTDQNGHEFNSQKEIIDGHYALIFFGFTHCPVVCPTELQKFASVMDMLPAETANKIQPIFITIDPERDTVATMQTYVPQFHEKIIGLTGKPDTVQKVLKEWKVYYQKVEDPQLNDYTMDHSTYAYLVDHDMTIVALYRMQNTEQQIAEDIKKIVR